MDLSSTRENMYTLLGIGGVVLMGLTYQFVTQGKKGLWVVITMRANEPLACHTFMGVSSTWPPGPPNYVTELSAVVLLCECAISGLMAFTCRINMYSMRP
jgi:hypothetical protein